MLVSKPARIVNTEEYICKVCPVPYMFISKKKLKEHGIRKHNGRQDQIKFGSSVLYLSEAEVQLQMNKEVVCEVCQQTFTCKQNLSLHRKEVHKLEERFNCCKCEKVFKKLKLMKNHITDVHKTPNFKC